MKKPNRDQNMINKAHQHLQDIENYETTGSIIHSKEKLILEQEKPNQFFFYQEKQKQKTIKKLKNDKIMKSKLSLTILKY